MLIKPEGILLVNTIFEMCTTETEDIEWGYNLFTICRSKFPNLHIETLKANISMPFNKFSLHDVVCLSSSHCWRISYFK